MNKSSQGFVPSIGPISGSAGCNHVDGRGPGDLVARPSTGSRFSSSGDQGCPSPSAGQNAIFFTVVSRALMVTSMNESTFSAALTSRSR